MKKIKLIAMTAAMGMAFAACQPSLIDGPEPFGAVESTVLAEGITYQQFADEACTQPDEAGNYLKFNSASGVVQVFLEGNEAPLYTGAGGVVKIPVKRGQEPVANLVFRIVNTDGTFTETTLSFNVTPPTELTPEMLRLVSDNGQKVWKYAPVTPYGNAGNGGNGAGFDTGAIDGQWWGVEHPDSLVNQIAHAGGQTYGDEASGAYMVFTEDGAVTTYNPSGQKVRSGKFSVKDYDPSRASEWEIGKLIVDQPALLFPWSINENGKGVTEYDIMYLTPQQMNLVYTKGNGPGSWKEISFWKFIAGSPDPLTMEGIWTYAAVDAYGNAGNSGAGANFNAPGVVDGKWWGATPADLSGQLAHAGGTAYGDEAEGAYMVFEGSTVNTFAPDGTKVRGGEWQAVMNDYASGAGRGAAGWEIGKFIVDKPALLFPWSINENGTGVTEYDIMYYDANNMTLVYTKGNGSGSWGEISFWNFVRKTE